MTDQTGEVRIVTRDGELLNEPLRYPEPGTTRLAEGRSFRTANELHVPVAPGGARRALGGARRALRGRDPQHRVPQVDGKIDMIPGRTNRLTIEARKPGVYEGHCAEFCGVGHALMRFQLVAHEPDDFDAWLERESAPAVVEPDVQLQQTYADRCGVCHDLRGVYESRPFRGDFGPDLTHFGARRKLGAGLLPNTLEALVRWLLDPQGVKPGNRMPYVGLDDDEVEDLVEFLGELR